MSHKDDQDNHADQLNPNNDSYWESRGWDDRPDDWEDRSESGETMPDERVRNFVLSGHYSNHHGKTALADILK